MAALTPIICGFGKNNTDTRKNNHTISEITANNQVLSLDTISNAFNNNNIGEIILMSLLNKNVKADGKINISIWEKMLNNKDFNILLCGGCPYRSYITQMNDVMKNKCIPYVLSMESDDFDVIKFNYKK